MKHQKMNRILAAALSAACLVPFAAMMPVDADAADVMRVPLKLHRKWDWASTSGTLWTVPVTATMTTSPALKSPGAIRQ